MVISDNNLMLSTKSKNKMSFYKLSYFIFAFLYKALTFNLGMPHNCDLSASTSCMLVKKFLYIFNVKMFFYIN